MSPSRASQLIRTVRERVGDARIETESDTGWSQDRHRRTCARVAICRYTWPRMAVKRGAGGLVDAADRLRRCDILRSMRYSYIPYSKMCIFIYFDHTPPPPQPYVARITIIDSGQTAILFVYEYMMAVSKAVPDGRNPCTVRMLRAYLCSERKVSIHLFHLISTPFVAATVHRK